MPARSHLGRSLWIDTPAENLTKHKRIWLKTSESDWGGDWTGSAVTMPVPQSPSSHTWHHACVYSREIHKPVIRSTDLLSCISCIHTRTHLYHGQWYLSCIQCWLYLDILTDPAIPVFWVTISSTLCKEKWALEKARPTLLPHTLWGCLWCGRWNL